jgi:Asp/Glu/hydantoin racemase
LILNPNTTEEVTRMIETAAILAAAQDTECVVRTAPWGLPYIATRAEATIAGHVVLEMLAEEHGGFDAGIIAAFGDPGLGGARELFDIPVIGISEGAMLTACMLGRRFSIITFSPALRPWYEECIAAHGLRERCASVRALDDPFSSVGNVQEENEARLLDLARRAVSEDGADVVIPAGTPLAGLARKLRDRIEVPVVDLVGSAVKQAELLVALNHRKAVAGTFRRPAAKPSVGLAAKLAARFGHEDEGA